MVSSGTDLRAEIPILLKSCFGDNSDTPRKYVVMVVLAGDSFAYSKKRGRALSNCEQVWPNCLEPYSSLFLDFKKFIPFCCSFEDVHKFIEIAQF